MTVRILTGDCRELLAQLEPESVQTCVTSPPYFGLRDYGHAGQLGLEATPDAFVAELVAVFREVRRVLRGDGTLWLNLGDSYLSAPRGNRPETPETSSLTNPARQARMPRPHGASSQRLARRSSGLQLSNERRFPGIKPKDLVGIPWMVAFALRTDGWYLRSDIIWHKPNPMPESVTDRPTKSHEYLFLLTKSSSYYYDADAIAERATSAREIQWAGETNGIESGESHAGSGESTRRFKARGSGNLERKPGSARGCPEGTGSNVAGSVPWEGITRNRRTVWTVPTQPFKGAHFATFPPALIEPCIMAGSKRGDTVLDPFGGAGTTGLVADRLGRDAVLCELNPEYAAMARARIDGDAPLFAEVAS